MLPFQPVLLVVLTGYLWRQCVKTEIRPLDTPGGNPKSPSPLHVAASINLTHVVARLLHEGNVDPNHAAENGFTALHLACIYNNKETATLLLDNGADLGARDVRGLAALHVASALDHRELVKLLIERGVDVDARGNNNDTALLYASANDQNNVAKLLLDGGADLHRTNSDGETPLAEATGRNHIDTVQLFLDRGVYNENTVDSSGEELSLALYLACKRGFLEVTKLLVNRGADASFRTASGQTPLLAAVRGGHTEVISLLLDEFGLTYEVYGAQFTLLHYASVKEDPRVAHLLLERGADIKQRTAWAGDQFIMPHFMDLSELSSCSLKVVLTPRPKNIMAGLHYPTQRGVVTSQWSSFFLAHGTMTQTPLTTFVAIYYIMLVRKVMMK